ncbi:CoA transferase [Tardibacter chloracetimidivorans]|uniref:CoA transferase n=1 Tax=Tardibacter chloracetimidivorans TaxID=1921510 RepID=A0A1L3ZW99_9SPHN|nr:CoA transferase [Tardibacter chloracetimidivorans]API59903.1 CoA transferase [Tardibacter chloracetimidivorans]
MSTSPTPEAAPLRGLRVLDMTRVVAGPLAGQILGDLGADVIKVERKGVGDESRLVGPPWMPNREGEESTYFQAVNRNKRSIAIDFAHPRGAEVIRSLARESDILLENHRPGTLDRYGLGYEKLREINPRLIFCSLTGFGQTGPYADRSGYDYLIQGMGGLMSVTGLPDGEEGAGPIRVGIPIVDIVAGLNLTIGVLAALQHRNLTGEGQAVDVALLDSELSVMLNAASSWLNSGQLLGRSGNDHPSATPYGIFDADDGQMIIAIFNDREFVRLAHALDRPEWAEDPRFRTGGARVAHRAEIKAAVTSALKGRPRGEWMELLNAAKVSCGPINDMADIVADPHTQARGMVVEQEHPVMGKVRSMGAGFKLSGSPVSYRYAPPLAGEHSHEILREVLGMSDEEIKRDVEADVVG